MPSYFGPTSSPPSSPLLSYSSPRPSSSLSFSYSTSNILKCAQPPNGRSTRILTAAAAATTTVALGAYADDDPAVRCEGDQDARIRRTREETLQLRHDQLREFLVLKERIPKVQASDPYEHSLATWIQRRRSKMSSQKTSLEDTREIKQMLHSINPGLATYKVHRKEYNRVTPEWEEEFKRLEAQSPAELAIVRDYRYSSTGEPYVPTARSFSEHVMRHLKCTDEFGPDECDPQKVNHGTMQHIFSYALHPNIRPSARKRHQYVSNAFEGDYSMYNSFHHGSIPPGSKQYRSGTLLPGSQQSPGYMNLLNEAVDYIMPDNLLHKMRECPTLDDFNKLERENFGRIYDTFNYYERGAGQLPIRPIMDLTTHSQPKRISFTPASSPVRYFPALGTHCQWLTSYGACGRPSADNRCRVMPLVLYNLGVGAWECMYPVLSPLNQVCPPTNVQILTYVQINEAEINSVKRKYDSQLESIHKIYHQGGKSTTEIRSGGKIKKSVKDQNMILHKDNGVLKQDGTMLGGNHDRSLNSQLYGSDVLTCTAGSTMNFLTPRVKIMNRKENLPCLTAEGIMPTMNWTW